MLSGNPAQVNAGAFHKEKSADVPQFMEMRKRNKSSQSAYEDSIISISIITCINHILQSESIHKDYHSNHQRHHNCNHNYNSNPSSHSSWDFQPINQGSRLCSSNHNHSHLLHHHKFRLHNNSSSSNNNNNHNNRFCNNNSSSNNKEL